MVPLHLRGRCLEYQLVVTGRLREGMSPEAARANISLLLGIKDEAKLTRLFSGRPLVIKKGLSAEQAERYCQHVQKAGLLCEVLAVVRDREGQQVQGEGPGTTVYNMSVPERLPRGMQATSILPATPPRPPEPELVPLPEPPAPPKPRQPAPLPPLTLGERIRRLLPEKPLAKPEATKVWNMGEGDVGTGMLADIPDRKAIHPWLAIWFWPNAAFRYLLGHGAAFSTFMLAMLMLLNGSLMQGAVVESLVKMGGVPGVKIPPEVQALVTAAMQQESAKLEQLSTPALVAGVLLSTCVLGGIFVYLSYTLWGAILRRSGAMLGGSATTGELRTVLIWGGAPFALVSILVLAAWFLSGQPGIFVKSPTALPLYQSLHLGQLQLVAWIWSLVLTLIGIGQVHAFSIFHAIACWLLGVVLIVLGVLAIVLAGVLLGSLGALAAFLGLLVLLML